MFVRSPIIHVMARAAEKAGKSLIRDFGEVEHLQVSQKGPGDFVSIADQKSEKILRDELNKGRPDFGFLMEESGEVKGKDPSTRFIIDPLDGTTNFLHGIPHWCISIGVEKNGEIIAGVVYEPLRDEMFWAEKGKGAFVNSRRLRVSGRKRLEDALLILNSPRKGKGDAAQNIREIETLSSQVAGLRSYGAMALDLCYVAAGRAEACWGREQQPWDLAAGILIVTEAGGFVSDLAGGKEMMTTGNILATNALLQSTLSKILEKK